MGDSFIIPGWDPTTGGVLPGTEQRTDSRSSTESGPTLADIIAKLVRAKRQNPGQAVDPQAVLTSEELALWKDLFRGTTSRSQAWQTSAYNMVGFGPGGVRPLSWFDEFRGQITAAANWAFAGGPGPFETEYGTPWQSFTERELRQLEQAGVIRTIDELAAARPELLRGMPLPADLRVQFKAEEEGRRVRRRDAMNDLRMVELIEWLDDGRAADARPEWLPEDYDIDSYFRRWAYPNLTNADMLLSPDAGVALDEALSKTVQDDIAGELGGTPKLDDDGQPVYWTDPNTNQAYQVYEVNGEDQMFVPNPVDPTGDGILVPIPDFEEQIQRRPWLIQSLWSTHTADITAEDYPTTEPTDLSTGPYIVPIEQRRRLVQEAMGSMTRASAGNRIGIPELNVGETIDLATRDAMNPSQFAPQYRDGDAARWLVSLDPMFVPMYQDLLIDAGLMSPNERSGVGMVGAGEVAAMASAMTAADMYGMSVDAYLTRQKDAMDELRAREEEDGGGSGLDRAPFVAPAYISPDYDTLKVSVRTYIGQLLGRNPEDYELALLADSMKADYDAQHRAVVAAARAEYDAMTRALESKEAQAAGTVQGVDPLSSLEERIRSRYAQEMENIDTRADMGSNMSNLLQSLAGMTGTVERG